MPLSYASKCISKKPDLLLVFILGKLLFFLPNKTKINKINNVKINWETIAWPSMKDNPKMLASFLLLPPPLHQSSELFPSGVLLVLKQSNVKSFPCTFLNLQVSSYMFVLSSPYLPLVSSLVCAVSRTFRNVHIAVTINFYPDYVSS